MANYTCHARTPPDGFSSGAAYCGLRGVTLVTVGAFIEARKDEQCGRCAEVIRARLRPPPGKATE